MSTEKNYDRLFRFCRPLVRILYPFRAIGVDNIPEGAALICPLHSNWVDPFIIAIAIGLKNRCHPLAKEETRSIPVFGKIMEGIGSIFVSRGEADIDAYKSCIRVLKNGEKLLAFPEGTRVHGDDVKPAKTGVIRMAARTGTPIVPVYLPRDKKPFRRVDVVFGEPYTIERAGHADYEPMAQDLMDRIMALRDTI